MLTVERGFLPVVGAPYDTIMPVRKTEHAAGYDFACPEDVVIPANGFKVIFTNVKAYMLENEYLAIYPRSSLFKKKHLLLANSVGIVDSDYFGNEDNDGNIGIALYNVDDMDITIDKGETIAQGIFTTYRVTSDDVLQPKGERKGGFGSTDENNV